MTEIKAKLSNYRQSPRKVRLVADLIRGKKVERAIQELNFVNKKASLAVKKLLQSAIANAKHNQGVKEKDLFLKEITVNAGSTLKRFRAGARGTAYPLKKRTSHIAIVLEDKEIASKIS
ncbi:MAG: 50S ribosomal protein L22 [Candidatus Pacebacteria bacterium]|nr:50S ribosomal protein L22 [Candidatus Paceibacterota bacterium]